MMSQIKTFHHIICWYDNVLSLNNVAGVSMLYVNQSSVTNNEIWLEFDSLNMPVETILFEKIFAAEHL